MGNTTYAAVSWKPEDAMEAAKHKGVTLTRGQAESWWAQNGEVFRGLLVEAGHDILREMNYTSGGLVPMTRTTEHVDAARVGENSFIRCTCELSRDYTGSGVFPGIFADLYYGDGDFDTIYWVAFENNIPPGVDAVHAAYAEMVRFANRAGKEFHVPVEADRDGFELYQKEEEDEEK